MTQPKIEIVYALYYKLPWQESEYFTGYFDETEDKVMEKARQLKDKGFKVRVVEKTISTRTIRAFQ